MARLIALVTATLVLCSVAPSGTPAQGRSYTDWGWPQPYEQVSQKSIEWLKGKGWWPLTYAYQPLWLGQSVIKVAGDMKFAQKRGLEVSFASFLAGPAVNEAIIAGKAQVGSGGPFPTTTMLSRHAPIKGLAVISYGYRHAVMVPTGSPAKRPADLRGKSVGLVVGSGAEYGYVAWAKASGLDPFKDMQVKNMPIPEQATMAKGLDAVVPWDPAVELMERDRKNATLFADTTEFMYYFGTMYVREEIVREAPDVAQALVDMFVETVLYSRSQPRQTAELLKRDPVLETYPLELIEAQNQVYVNQLKPTWTYPFASWIAVEGERVARWLHQGGRIKTEVTADDFKKYLVPTFMEATYKKLGWKVPAQPPYFPPGTTLDTLQGWAKSETPYKQLLPYHLKAPQAFPEPGDLSGPWSFRGKTYEPR
jgi:ABC-type nitrate/sulfonate/bicarbonate transport system substrate-binding protein